MVFEFAVEPELVAACGEQDNYRYFYEKFGIGQPRIMSEYPKLQNWRRQVLQAASGKTDEELQRITAMIAILSEARISRKTDGYNGNIEWLRNAEKEDTLLPFHAILALSNPRNHPSVLMSQMLGVSSNSKWHINEQLPDVPRKAFEMAKAVRPLLINCRTAIFIDPYFMRGEKRWKWQRPFSAFMREFLSERHELSELRIEVHSADPPGAPSEKDFEKHCRKELEDDIPYGLRICFKRWKQKPGGKKLHDRYLITDIGGVNFSIGLDEGETGETQNISLLKRNTYEIIWEDYISNHPAFDIDKADGFTIEGKKASRLNCKPN
jgi:hypothetical protein